VSAAVLIPLLVGAALALGYLLGRAAAGRGASDERELLLARERSARAEAQRAQRQSRVLAGEALGAEETVRRRISEILHDDALQTLLAASQDIREAAEGQPEALERASEALEQTIARLREVVFELHPIALEYGGLEAALKAIARHRGRRGQYQARVRVAPEAAGIHDLLLISVARELLTNVAKHAGAGAALVSVARGECNVVLQVSDDGRGMSAADRRLALERGHIGLASSSERVAAAGGELEVISGPGEGTVVRILLPAEPTLATRRSSRRPGAAPPAPSGEPAPRA